MTRLYLAVALTMMLFGGAFRAQAQEAGQQVYIVTHVDTFGGEKAAEAARILQQFAADSRKDPGSVRFELLREPTRLNHFTIVEVWRSKQDFEAHLEKAHSVAFRQKIQPILGGPFDERLHVLLP